jgi:hypothetical protein
VDGLLAGFALGVDGREAADERAVGDRALFPSGLSRPGRLRSNNLMIWLRFWLLSALMGYVV